MLRDQCVRFFFVVVWWHFACDTMMTLEHPGKVRETA